MAQQKAVESSGEDDDLVDELQPGTKLLKGQYTIVRYINSGGFGITYLAKDSLDRDVVIKECFPGSFCRRSKVMVTARSRAHTAELRSVIQLFVREARNLSKIVHPNIVAVHQVFEDNGTAYMAIDFIDGLDLQQIIDGEGAVPNIEEIVLITEKLLAAVGFIHSNDMLHRDISPDNVLIDKKGQPVLIDFGAAREQASKTNRAMSALRVVKDGYSPQEFYIAGSEQGPWSDLYALGATLYHLISGEAPANGQARLAALAEDQPDPYIPLAGRFQGFPPGFLAAVDKALSTMPKQRVQSAQEWLSMFRPGIKLPVEPSDNIAAAVQAMIAEARAAEATVRGETAPATSFGATSDLGRQVSQPAPLASTQARTVEYTTASEPQAVRRSGMPVQLVGGIAAALAIVGLGVMFMRGEEAPAPTKGATETAAAALPAAGADTASASGATDEPAVAATDTAAAPVAAAPEAAEAETAATEATAPAEQSAETPAASDTASETAPATSEPVAELVPEPEPAPEPAAETQEEAAAETAEVEAPVSAPAETANQPLLENQVSFAAWDAEIPFIEDNRFVGGERVSIILRLLPGLDRAVSGDWLATGLILYSINGVDIQQSGGVTAAVLNAMNVDPDGKARVVVEYSGSSLERETGLMTVTATRLVSLASGISVRVGTVDGEWKTVVTDVSPTAETSLLPGDTLFRDKTSGTALDGPTSLEEIMSALVQTGTRTTEFSVIRDNRVTDAFMQLTLKP